MNSNKCCICGSSMEQMFEFHNKTADTINLFEKPVKEAGTDILFLVCPLCGHGQISFTSKAVEYEDFIPSNASDFAEMKNGKAFSPLDECVQEEFQKFINHCKNTTRFLDIGCGTGALLAKAAESFDSVLGVEPSKPAIQIAEERLALCEKKHKIKNCYFEDGREYYPVSAFAAIEVFEHLDDPLKTLINTRHALIPDGVGLIEVPNGSLIMDKGMYTDVYHQHLHYYTPASLALLARKAGFDVISVNQAEDGRQLFMTIKKSGCDQSFESRIQNEKTALNDGVDHFTHVGIWGAGVKARSYICLIDHPEAIRHVFDISRQRIGRFLSGCVVPVEGATKETIGECDLIINFTSAHNNEVLSRLIGEFNYQGSYLYFDDAPNLINCAEIKNAGDSKQL